VPFLSRTLAAKLAVQDALETIQDVVSEAAGSRWPGPHYTVRVETQADGVRTWFERGLEQIDVAVIAYDLAS
jgi:hypothetical protein